MAADPLRNYLLMIPAPLGGVIRGGWINGSFVVFFAIATFVFWQRAESRIGNASS